MGDVSSGDAMGALLLGALVLLEVSKEICARNAISRRGNPAETW
jgi:hypothetical protein